MVPIASSTISLPFHNNLSDEEIDYVVEKVREGIEKFGGRGIKPRNELGIYIFYN
jgi:hypothetical protein